MAGAIRPPWIDKEMFYRMPFNFCDRWCERCYLGNRCRVYISEQASRRKYLRQKRDPDSWECVFESIKDSFEETKKLIEKGAKKWGFDISNIDDSDYQSPPEPEDLPLYILFSNYCLKLKKLLRDLSIVPVGVDEKLLLENAHIISYYELLIPAKIYRAITSKIEEEEDEEDKTKDSNTSAFIVVNSLKSISKALNDIADDEFLVVFKKRALHLKNITSQLIEVICEEFDLLEKKN